MWGQITVHKICISKSWPYFHCGYLMKQFLQGFTQWASHTYCIGKRWAGNVNHSFTPKYCVNDKKISDDEIFLCTQLHNFKRYWQYHSLNTKCHLAMGEFGLHIFLKKCQKSSHFLASCHSWGLSEIPLKFNKISQEDLCNVLTCYYFHFESNI